MIPEKTEKLSNSLELFTYGLFYLTTHMSYEKGNRIFGYFLENVYFFLFFYLTKN